MVIAACMYIEVTTFLLEVSHGQGRQLAEFQIAKGLKGPKCGPQSGCLQWLRNMLLSDLIACMCSRSYSSHRFTNPSFEDPYVMGRWRLIGSGLFHVLVLRLSLFLLCSLTSGASAQATAGGAVSQSQMQVLEGMMRRLEGQDSKGLPRVMRFNDFSYIEGR